MKILFSFIILTLGVNIMSAENLKLILPTEEKINFCGRIDSTEKDVVKYSWSGVSFSFLFYGKELVLIFEDGYNDYEVFMDGKYLKTIETTTFKKKYKVFSSEKKEKHYFEIVKRTGANYGIGVFKGILVDDEAVILDNPKNYNLKFEFIGDSITCGYGIEADSPTIPNARRYENFTKTYAYLLSKMLNAEYHAIAISGKGLVRNYAEPKEFSLDPLPTYYKRTLQGIDVDDWNFNNFLPDVVFIALGENDFSTIPYPKEELYFTKYKEFVSLIRKNYPKSKIVMICTISSREIYRNTLSRIHKRLLNEFNNLYYFEFPSLQNNELGCDSHPNYLANKRFADELYKFGKVNNLW